MNIGLIFAGGSGVRMNTKGLPKQFLEMNGKAIIIHTIEHFEKCKAIDAIVIVCLKDYIEYLEDLLDRDRITKVRKLCRAVPAVRNPSIMDFVQQRKFQRMKMTSF